MKKINKISTVILSIALILGIAGPTTTFAATDPGLGAAETFSIIAQTSITGTGTISGDVGMNSTGAGITALTAEMVGGTIYSTNGVAPSVATPFLDPDVQANLSTANGNISSQGSTASIGPVLNGLTVTTGVYDIGAGRLNGVLTLDGPGIYIFRASSDLVSSGSINLINGARACDVYWKVNTLATINGSEFTGTIIAGTGVHFGNGVALDGRALALGGDVTLINNTISGPTCAAPEPEPEPEPAPATLHVVKTVINNNDGTAVASDFTIDVAGTNVSSSSFAGSEAGVDVTLDAGAYAVTETSLPGYLQTGSGNCSGTIAAGETKTCTITNDDIAPVVPPPSGGGGGSSNLGISSSYYAPPPLIDVVKVPSPLALPDGPGTVKYTYTLRNIGTVSVGNVTMIGDTCSPITLISGDANTDTKLDVNETWIYTCSTTLSKTHTNIVTATGWANGISATDIANATVIVGFPIVPPLIHVTKVPNPLVLSFGEGIVTYTNKVTNPGTVALSNVRLTDDKCAPVKYVSGDTNSNLKLDTTETWTYTCQTTLTKTTVNTITASGEANGLTARDFAIATVVVAAAPKLPNAGLPLGEDNILWNVIVPAGLFGALILFYFARRKKTV